MKFTCKEIRDSKNTEVTHWCIVIATNKNNACNKIYNGFSQRHKELYGKSKALLNSTLINHLLDINYIDFD